MTDTNVIMDFVCVRGCWDTYGIVKGHACKLISVDADRLEGLVCLTIERRDGAYISLVTDSQAWLSEDVVRCENHSGQRLYLRKVMRKPWRFDQMMRGYLNTDNSLASVSVLPKV